MVKKKSIDRLVELIKLTGCEYEGSMKEGSIIDSLRVVIQYMKYDAEITRRERDEFRRRYYDSQEQ